MMDLTVTLPDDIAARLGGDGADFRRRALEALAAEEHRAGRLNKADPRQLLGFETGHEIDGFLKAHDVFEPYMFADLEREREVPDRLGL